MMKPCDNCKRKPNCPNPCYPLKDWQRGQKKKRYARRGKMSWYSDGEPFDEYDPPYCENCKRGNSYEECAACERMHNKAGEGEEE